MPICEAGPTKDTEIPEILLRYVETLNRLLQEQGYDAA